MTPRSRSRNLHYFFGLVVRESPGRLLIIAMPGVAPITRVILVLPTTLTSSSSSRFPEAPPLAVPRFAPLNPARLAPVRPPRAALVAPEGILPALGERPSGRSPASPGAATRPFPALPTPTCGARGRRLSLLWPSGTSTEATPRCLPLPHSSGQRPPTCHTLGHWTQSILGPKTSPFPRCRP